MNKKKVSSLVSIVIIKSENSKNQYLVYLNFRSLYEMSIFLGNYQSTSIPCHHNKQPPGTLAADICLDRKRGRRYYIFEDGVDKIELSGHQFYSFQNSITINVRNIKDLSKLKEELEDIFSRFNFTPGSLGAEYFGTKRWYFIFNNVWEDVF